MTFKLTNLLISEVRIARAVPSPTCAPPRPQEQTNQPPRPPANLDHAGVSTPTPATPDLAPGRRFVPPRSDLLFKAIFADARNTDLLVGFLQSVLDLPEADWTTLTLPNTHATTEKDGDKTGVLDVKVTTATGPSTR